MNLLTNGILMVSAAMLAIAAIHLRMCFDRRNATRHTFFVIAACSFAVYALFERAMLLAETPAEYGILIRLVHVAVWSGIVFTALFLHSYLGPGRKWLLWSIIVIRTLSLLINFISPVSLNYLELNSISKVSFLGELVSVPVGVTNPAVIIGQASILLLVIYCIDAAIKSWRLGNRQRAIFIGGSFTLFALTSLTATVLTSWGIVSWPFFASPFFLGIIASMGFELTRDIHRTAQLAEDLNDTKVALSDSSRQLELSADAANVGTWTRKVGETTIFANPKWKELFGFDPDQPVEVEDFRDRVHPEDLELVLANSKAMETFGNSFDYEFRIILPSGEVRWMASRGQVNFEGGKPAYLRGASVDITERKLVEEHAHELSRKLMVAQENERARIARELHDDLSQSLALLAIQLQVLGKGSEIDHFLKARLDELTEQIQRISSDVHRISHELHPSKLSQLGLEASLGGFCREIARAHALKVQFEAKNIPRVLPEDVSLCVYRIAQESLQNVVKHSDASIASVTIERKGDEIRLIVSDNGRGFDPEAARSQESLGLISMEERIRVVKGQLNVVSVIGSGTKVCVDVPAT
jgi:PAS domain S-box-containing protein